MLALGGALTLPSMSDYSSAIVNIFPLVTWSVILVEQNALAGATWQIFERHRGSSNYNNDGIGSLLLSTNDEWEKFNKRSSD